VLTRAQLLTAGREGRWMVYALQPELIDAQLHALLDLLAPGPAERTECVMVDDGIA
jgi:hypothetical protein